MTGKIEDSLFSSEAARSLLMERRVADRLRAHKWNGDTGIYYTDKETNKLREMDVFGIQVFDKPRKSKDFGAPLINLILNCECKSLSGTNVLFVADSPKDKYWDRGQWIGFPRELETVVTNIAEQAKITDHGRIKRLYDYVADRAYANGGRALTLGVSMDPPPIDMIAWSFRETRSGKYDEDHANGRNQSTPVWNSIRAALEAAQAARRKAVSTSLDWVYGLDLKFYGVTEFARSAAYFLDCELFRSEFFHSFVVLDARLWQVTSQTLAEKNSVRLYVSNIDHTNSYVDLVNSSFIDQYIDSMINHYEKAARRSNLRQWKTAKEIGWAPGQEQKRLLKILQSKSQRPRSS